jgi:hypothetical protein
MPMHNQIIVTETAAANITAILVLLLVLLQLLLILIKIIYKKGQTISRTEKVSSREILGLEKSKNLHKKQFNS